MVAGQQRDYKAERWGWCLDSSRGGKFGSLHLRQCAEIAFTAASVDCEPHLGQDIALAQLNELVVSAVVFDIRVISSPLGSALIPLNKDEVVGKNLRLYSE